MLCFKMTNYLNFQALFTIALPSNLKCICRGVNLAVGEPTRQYMLAFTASCIRREPSIQLLLLRTRRRLYAATLLVGMSWPGSFYDQSLLACLDTMG
jgi:hypothetical protein